MALELDPHLALFYDYVDDIVEARKPFREAHLGAAREAETTGALVTFGALGDPPTGGLFIFKGTDRSVAERYAQADPYMLNGLITAWRVEPWNVVV